MRLAQAGQAVIVTYEGETFPGTRFRNTEILTKQDGQVVQAPVNFGRNPPHAAAPSGFVDGGEG